MENFGTFIRRHRFELRHLFPSAANGAPKQNFDLARQFPDNQYFNWAVCRRMLELNQAFALAEYMSECETSEPDGFSKYVSSLSDEAWSFAIQFTPYSKVSTALENLEVVRAAMFEAVLALNAAKAGMEVAVEFSGFSTNVYDREKSKATSNLLNFSALYASYIDVCRRIRKYAGQVNDKAYKRAIDRLVNRNSGAHGFIKGFRNFILHYHLPQPGIKISYGATRSVEIYLNSNSLLYSGFDWTVDARSYIQSGELLDIEKVTTIVFKDVEKLIKFHQKIVEKRLCRERRAFDTYLYERCRFKHLQNSAMDLSAALRKRPTPMIFRLVNKDLIEQVLNSLLPDDEAKLILSALADRHRNLSLDAQKAVTREIEKLLKERTRFNNTGAYLQGREFG